MIVSTTDGMRTSRDIRDLSMFLAGYCYCRGNENFVHDRLSYGAFPEDVASLLGGLQRREAQWVIEWFAARGATIDAEHLAPEAALERIRQEWLRNRTKTALASLEFSRHLEPGQALHLAKQLVAELEAIGVVSTPPLNQAPSSVENQNG